ncbi:hypothetical protein [Wenyingzhuangia sp. IMCC45574]
MKKKLFLLLLITSIQAYSQSYVNENPKIDSKNEIRTLLIANTGGPHFSIEYERMINSSVGVGLFAKRNTLNINPNESYELEDFGFGIKTRFYLNEYRTSSFFENLGVYNVAKRLHAEFFVEYVSSERYETQRNTITYNVYVIERVKLKNNAVSINLGIGKKFLFNKRLNFQFNIGLSKYLPKQRDLDFGGYLNTGLGYQF